MPAMQGVRNYVATVKIKVVDPKYLCLLFPLVTKELIPRSPLSNY
jgi:hypothetical protein